jgi:hypothetical protein
VFTCDSVAPQIKIFSKTSSSNVDLIKPGMGAETGVDCDVNWYDLVTRYFAVSTTGSCPMIDRFDHQAKITYKRTKYFHEMYCSRLYLHM